MPCSVIKIGNNAFSNTGIFNNTVNNNVVYVDKWAVGYKGTVIDAALNADTAGIGTAAFANNASFSRVYIPVSIKYIGADAFTGCPALAIYAQAPSKPAGWNANWNSSNRTVYWNSPAAYQRTVTATAIPGVTPPVTGETPVTSIGFSDQYTGTVAWNPNHSVFAENTVYTATVTLTAKTDWTLQGIPAYFFSVFGTSLPATNNANSGIVAAVFPLTIDALTKASIDQAVALAKTLNSGTIQGSALKLSLAGTGFNTENAIHMRISIYRQGSQNILL